jgi:hypothetical protein
MRTVSGRGQRSDLGMRVAGLLLLVLLAASAMAAPAASPASGSSSGQAGRQAGQSAGPPTAAEPGKALLATGPAAIKGLPFFSPNAIPSLSGAYLVGAETLPVWYTREGLQFGGQWKERPSFALGGGRAWTLAANERFVVAWKQRRFSLIVSFPSERAFDLRFSAALLTRFTFFFENAATDAELSFPAVVQY